jgi:ABC-type multidrug transport system ATPase subunit
MKPIEVISLSKSYGKVEAVKSVSFEVERGTIFGLIGPDGAGKTTIFRMLTTLLTPDSGEARVEGMDILKDYRAIRAHVGYMPGRFSLYQDLSIEENLNFFASLFQVSVEENMHLVEPIYKQIEPFKKRRAGKLSGGMKQKLALCCAMIHKPTVVFLDEPTTGVDAVSRSEFWDMLAQLRDSGITIVVSTPYMDEASRCDKIAFMKEGTILTTGTPNEILSAYGKRLFAMESENMYLSLQQLQADERVDLCYSFGSTIHFTLRDGVQAEKNWAEIQPQIEDCYIALSR